MYESYFHLRERPFDIVPNPAYLYLSKTHKLALMYLKYGLKERLGFVLMTGEVGSGKTTLIRELIRTLSPEITLARLFNTRVSSEELIAMINDDFGLDTVGKSKVHMLKELYAYLIKEYEEDRRPLLIIDEAQNLSPDLLEEIRMLSNLETDTDKLLQIMLVGQPELGQSIALPQMRQLRQRIRLVCHIRPLTNPEAEEYILHRLSVAGNREALSFKNGAFDAIYAATAGIPRQINTLCDFILLTAFTEERSDVTAEMVKEIACSLDLAEKEGVKEQDNPKPTSALPQEKNGPAGKLALLRALGVTAQHNEQPTSEAPNIPQAAQ